MRICSLLSPKENQKRAASCEARGTTKGLLAPWNPKEEQKLPESGGVPAHRRYSDSGSFSICSFAAKKYSFPRFSTWGILQRMCVENCRLKNSRLERLKIPRCGKPRKINFCPRLSFGKKKKSLHFSPKASSIRLKEYNRYNGTLPKRWKTRWKKWKTLWETPLLFHKSSGKPSGKS